MSKKKTIDYLPKNWQELIFQMMGEGKPKESVLVAFDISRNVHGRMMKEVPDYKECFEKGELLREKFWQEQILAAATKKDEYKGDSRTLIFAAKNILGWRSEPFNKERENVLGDKTGEKEIMEQFKKKEKTDEKVNVSNTVN